MFKVDKVVKEPRTVYKLKDFAEEPITGLFYPEEIERVDKSGEATYKIEKIIRKRKVNGHIEVLVKWKGWPTKFNSWINQEDVVAN